jgi:hypothetical protein
LNGRWTAAVRRSLSTASPAANLVVLLLALAALGFAVRTALDTAPTTGAVALVTLFAFVAVFLLSSRFSTRLMRSFAFLFFFAIVVSTVRLGRVTLRDDARADARGAASALALDGVLPRTNALCESAAGTFTTTTSSPSSLPPLCLRDPHAPAPEGVTLLPLRRRLAEAEAATTTTTGPPPTTAATGPAPTTTTPTTSAKLRQALGDAAATTEKFERRSVWEAMSAGATAIFERVSGSHDDGIPLAPELAGWILLGGLALVLYRLFETRAADTGVGPVTIEGPKSGGEGAKSGGEGAPDAAYELFRTYVVRNVPEPAAVPGGSALTPLTDLLEAAPASTPASWIGTVLKATLDAAKPPIGYVVSYAHVRDVAASGTGAISVVVRVRTARTGRLLEQETFPRPEPGGRPTGDRARDEVLREAAYWAASRILKTSDRIPQWARWPEDTSHALAVFYSARDNGVVSSDARELAEAVARAPRCGLLVVQLAHRYTLAKRYLDALALYAQVVSMYPDYHLARYRLAITCGFIADDFGTTWGKASPATQQRVVETLRRYCETCPRAQRGYVDELIKNLSVVDGSELGAARAQFCRLARANLKEVRERVRLPRVLATALGRDQRSYQLGLLASPSGLSSRTRFRDLVDSADLALQLRGGQRPDDRDLASVERRARRAETWWQVAYNLACFYALRANRALHAANDVDAAFAWLERAVEQRGSHQLTKEWFDGDPDLRALRGNPRYDAIRERLPSEGT